MFPKVLAGLGAAIIFFGIAATPLGVYISFASMENAEVEGISGVKTGIDIALWGGASTIIGGVFLAVGLVLFYKQKKKLSG